ncbi:MAG: ankyrin repeat domain-containing protein [Legionellaceae bacterium]|nr:ankyrin repeat domain-containing protein [Legionellaceae bacterium]
MPRLHLAAASGDVEKVLSYLKAGDDINDMNESVTHEGQVWTPGHGHAGRKMTPLHLAAYNGHTAIVEVLARAGALLNERDAWRDVPGNTALEMAVDRKNFTTAIKLEKLGALFGVGDLYNALYKRNIRDELMHAAIYKKPQNIYAIHAEGLLEKEAADYALRLGAEYGALSVIKALLDCGVDVNACDLDEPIGFNFNSMKHKTPLGIAAEYGREEAVLLLLERGAEVDKPTHINPNQTTNTPLRKAMCHLDFKNSNPQLFENLLSYGADYKKVDDIAWSFFAEKGSAEEMAVFLRYGFDPNRQYKGKPYLLHCINAHRTIAMPLIMGGADLHYIDEEGKNYLHHSRDSQLTQLLLEKDLNPSLRDKKGKTPIHYVDQQSAEILADIQHKPNWFDFSARFYTPKELYHLSLHDHRVLSSPKLFRQLNIEVQPNIHAVDEKGMSVLRKLAHGASFEGYLENLIWLVENTMVDVNQASQDGGWTALHDAFSQIQGYVSMDYSDQDVAENKYAQAIDALIAHGAKPIPDKQGRTPLMCLTYNEFSTTYNHAVIERYHRFEAEHYGVDATFYKPQFYSVRDSGFKTKGGDFSLPIISLYAFSVPIPKILAAFWESIEAGKQIHDEQEEVAAMVFPGRKRLSIFAIRDAQLDFPMAQFLEKFEAEQNLISEATGFYDLYFSCQINFSEKTAPEVLEELVEKMKQQGLTAEYKSLSRCRGLYSGHCIEIKEKKEILKSWVDSNDANFIHIITNTL